MGYIINVIDNIGNPIIYNNNLYFGYQNADSILQLAKYDGTSISLIPNPDAGFGDMSIFPIIFNNNLYFIYQNTYNILQLAKYDGNSITLIPNPNAGIEYYGYDAEPIIFNNSLYLGYANSSGIYQLAKYDGTSITLIPNPDAGIGCISIPIIYNNNLYFEYMNKDSILQLAKLSGSSGIDEISRKEIDFDIYPNPASNNITISNKDNVLKETEISIFNFEGQQIMTEKFNSQNKIEIDVSLYSKGVYFVKIQTDNGIMVKKFVKE